MKKKNLKDIQESGFKVPKDYFQDFDASIMQHIKLKEKVDDAGFSIPEGYFENVEEQILQKVTSKESGKVIPLFNKRNVIYISSIAAAILLLFNVSLFNNNSVSDYSSLAFETVEDYILDEEIASDEIASLFEDSDFTEDSFHAVSILDEDIENYVNDNLEINDLYIE